MPRPHACVCAALALALAGMAYGAAPAAPRAGRPPVRHVFVLLLENQSYESAFGGSSPAPYLARTLPARGALLTRFFSIAHSSLPNYIALVSGQAANEETQLDCPFFGEFVPEAAALDANGQLPGKGCVYPRLVPTLPDQLEAAGFTWKGYMEDMGKDPARESASCGHVPVGTTETTNGASPRDQYAAKHNPFIYFHSIIEDRARCDAHVVNLVHLRDDLRSVATTPNYAFITPNLCNDGHDPRCVDGRPGGLTAIDAFLREWVPLIEAAPAFRADGLLVITFDESVGADSRACCGERALPGARFQPGFNGPGGGRIGAVVLSPYVKPGTVSAVPYNHYSLLRTVEASFGLPGLGYAAAPGLRAFGADVFTAAAAAGH